MRALLAAMLVLASGAARADEVPADLAGRYAPGGNCARQPVLTVDRQGILVQYNGRQGKLAPVDVCRTCVGGMRYQGIEVWIGPNTKGGDQPFIFRFNADEKRGRLLVEQQSRGALPPIVGAMVRGSPYMRCRG